LLHPGNLRFDGNGERSQRCRSDRLQQIAVTGEVAIRSIGGDSGRSSRFTQHNRLRTTLTRQLYTRFQQGSPQVAVTKGLTDLRLRLFLAIHEPLWTVYLCSCILSCGQCTHVARHFTAQVTMSSFETSPRLTPFLWFDNNAEEAVNFYLSIFKNSRRLDAVQNHGDQPAPAKVLTIAFELDGQRFTALNGGPMFKFNEAVSFVIRCDSQEEVDEYWRKLSAGGSEGQCGWLKDKFGLSWQVVPARLPDLIKKPKAMQAMLKMRKLDIAELERAAEDQEVPTYR
jgi:predicted 3-demethylubiquinone-9 3-methyltransferase (glyoxalase superfamily)